MRVRERFAELQATDEKENRVPWHIIDASRSIETVQDEINRVVEATIKRVEDGAPLYKMFEDGEYQLPSPSSIKKE